MNTLLEKPNREPDYISKHGYSYWFEEMIRHTGSQTSRLDCWYTGLYFIDTDNARIRIGSPIVQEAFKTWLLNIKINNILLGTDDP